jgi:hypothetical protein
MKTRIQSYLRFAAVNESRFERRLSKSGRLLHQLAYPLVIAVIAL